MTQRTDGNFDVDPREQITITITKSEPNCDATVRVSGATLACVPNPQFPICQQCSFTAPDNSGADVRLEMTLGFQSDPQGNFDPNDSYTVVFSGAGGSSETRDFFPPSVFALVYHFFVR
jgi:hypothetical protein